MRGSGYVNLDMNVSATSIKDTLAMDEDSIECKNKSSHTVSVSFDIFMKDFLLEGNLNVSGYEMHPKQIKIRSFGIGKVISQTKLFLVRKFKPVTKNELKNQAHFQTDFNWGDPNFASEQRRKDAEDLVDKTLNQQFPRCFNHLIHQIVYDETLKESEYKKADVLELLTVSP